MLKGFKTRIYPTKKQEEILFIYCEYAHKMRNFLVGKFNNNLPNVNNHGIIGYKEKDLEKDFTEQRENFKILLPKRILRGVLVNYALSTERFKKRISNKPKFHKYNPNKQSFYIPQPMKISNGEISLPHNKEKSVKGMSKIKVEKQYIDKFNITEVKESHFTYKNGKWYLSGCYEDNNNISKKETTFIGLDWGIKNFMTTSTGKYLNYPEKVSREYMRIRKLQSIKDKKVKDSNNYKKISNKLEKAWDRFDNLKNDFIEQTTTRLCKDYDIVVEDLTNQKITKSNKSRRRLQMIAPRYRFIRKLEWKCLKFGTQFIEVNPAYTSQECSNCHKRHYMTLKDRIFRCDCGLELDRDINAAINIAARGYCNAL